MRDRRPLTKVIYELDIITSDGEIRQEFSTSYDSDFYDQDKESTDLIFVNMRMADMREKYGSDTMLLDFSVGRERQVLH